MASTTLCTPRLVLRPFTLADAPRVQLLAGNDAVARRTLLIPHPYPDGAAEQWIASHDDQRDVVRAITLATDGTLIGAMELGLAPAHRHAELGYWLGEPYWNQGYCTEAAMALVDYGFRDLRLHRITCSHFGSNPASGRVMQKLGMKYEGTRAQHYFIRGQFEDSVLYGLISPWAT